MANFNGMLPQNHIFQAIFDMIISQTVFSGNIYTTNSSLADKSRVEGTLYGSSKLFYSTDILKSYEWLGDAEAQNLLKLHRPEAPQCQQIIIDQYRMVPVTVDAYLSKNAFATEGAFSAFNAQILGAMRDTKNVYDATMFNSFVGTHTAGLNDDGVGAKQNVQITIPAEPDGVDDYNTEAYNRIVAQTIAQKMADLLVDLKDTTRDYNNFGNLRSYNPDDMVFVFNSEWVNKITKLDTPTIWHKDGLVDKLGENALPPRFFGNVNTNSGTTGSTNLTIRSLIEKDYNVVEMGQAGYDRSKHIFAGDLLPANTPYEANETYTEDNTIIFKAYHKNSIPFMTSFQSGSEFINPRSLTQTHYLIWGYNKLQSLDNFPFITAKVVQAG